LPANYQIAETVTHGGITVDLLEWREFSGLTDPRALELMAAIQLAKMPLRQIRLTLQQQSSAILEAGGLQFSAGTFDVENRIPFAGTIKRVFGSMVSGVKLFRPRYNGIGELWLQPAFHNFLIISLNNNSIVVENGMFLCCDAGVEISTKMLPTISSALFSGESLFQTMLSGTGFVVLSSPVAQSEIVKIAIKPGQRIQVDGQFVLLRTAGVNFSVAKSARTWFGTATSGEGLMQTFEGHGHVWVAPTLPTYNYLGGLSDPMAIAAEAMAAAAAERKKRK